jgi:hypothetical protein
VDTSKEVGDSYVVHKHEQELDEPLRVCHLRAGDAERKSCHLKKYHKNLRRMPPCQGLRSKNGKPKPPP